MDWTNIRAKLARLWRIGTYMGDGHVCEGVTIPKRDLIVCIHCGDAL